MIEAIKETLNKPLVFIGTGGAGKTTIGQLLADRLGLAFVDCDHVLEEKEGMSIPQMFAEKGEAYFRNKERDNIRDILGQSAPQVVSTGGGAFMDKDIRTLILEETISIFLKADLETLLHRVGSGEGRPLFDNQDPRAVLEKMIVERYPIYEQAHIVIESDGEDSEETTQKVITALYNHLHNE